jgi:CubicO group peptidase (beta-lactamase class C family)
VSPAKEGTLLRRWRWWIAAIVVLGCLLAAWRVVIAVSERTEPVAGPPLPSCGAYDPEYSAAVREARAEVQAMMRERRIPGLSAAAAIAGKIIWSEGFGFADLEKRVPACPETRFRVASVSKPLTATAVAQLYEQGRLDIDAPVRRYVPSFPDKGHPITTRQLSGHLGGIRHYRDENDVLSTKHYGSVLESLERFQDDPLVGPPGTEFHYSTYGYVLLSAVIEGASGEDFLSYMHRHIFAPLKMEHTSEERVEIKPPDRTVFYDLAASGAVMDAPCQDLSYKWAGGGFLSTAEDLVRFGSAYTQGGFLKPQTIELLFTPQSKQLWIQGYGMGWMVARDLHLRRVAFHFGAQSGGSAVES